MVMSVTKLVLGFVIFIGLTPASANVSLSSIMSKLCQINGSKTESQCVERSDGWFVLEKGSLYRYSKKTSEKTSWSNIHDIKSIHLLRNKHLVLLTSSNNLYISARDRETNEEKHFVQIASRISHVATDKDHLIAVYTGAWRFSSPQILWFYYPDSQIVYGRPGGTGFPSGLNVNYVLGQTLAGYKNETPFYETEIINHKNIYTKNGEIWIEFEGKVHLPWSIVLENINQFADSTNERVYNYALRVYNKDKNARIAFNKMITRVRPLKTALEKYLPEL